MRCGKEEALGGEGRDGWGRQKWRMEVVDRLCRRTEQNGREASELVVVAAGDARARWRREGFAQLPAVRLDIDERGIGTATAEAE